MSSSRRKGGDATPKKKKEDNNTTNNNDDNDDDDRRRQAEISFFSALALGGAEPISKKPPPPAAEPNAASSSPPRPRTVTTTTKTKSLSPLETTPKRATKVSSAFHDVPDNNDDDDDLVLVKTPRQRQQASGNGGGGGNGGGASSSSSVGAAGATGLDAAAALFLQNMNKPPPLLVQQNNNNNSNPFQNLYSNDDDDDGLVKDTSGGGGGGTFFFEKQVPKGAEKSNLDAALAALEQPQTSGGGGKGGGGGGPPKTKTTSFWPNNGDNKGVIPPRPPSKFKGIAHPEDAAPMFAEQVLLPRPLFFGTQLPPRVLREARNMIQQAYRDLGYYDDPENNDNNNNNNNKKQQMKEKPRLSQLPDEVRNVVGALRAYGHGVDVLEPEGKEDKGIDDDVDNEEALLSTFQPVWDDTERARRIKEYKKHARPHIVSRSTTAPARLGHGPNKQRRDNGGSMTWDDFAAGGLDASFTESVGSFLGSSSATAQGDHPLTAPLTSPTLTNTSRSSPGNFSAAVASLSSSSSEPPTSSSDVPPTETGQSTSEGNAASPRPSRRMSENEQFTMWIRGDDADSVASPPFAGESSIRSMEDLPGTEAGNLASGEEGATGATATNAVEKKKPLTEQELFSQWAQGPVGTTVASAAAGASGSIAMDRRGLQAGSLVPTNVSAPAAAFDSNTFQRQPVSNNAGGDDDDDVVFDELKKQVGLNDHLSKALASLANDGGGGGGQGPDIDEETHVLLSQIPQDGSQRPLANYEVSNGCVPLFGVDDAPLPVEGDLGIHETREEQQRSYDQKRSQDIVEKCVGPNIFGPIVCPNPALHPDDFHSWNARVGGTQRGGGIMTNVPNTVTGGTMDSASLSLPSVASRRTATPAHDTHGAASTAAASTDGNSRTSKHHKDTAASKRLTSRPWYGWWNAGREEDWPATVSRPHHDKDATDRKLGTKDTTVDGKDKKDDKDIDAMGAKDPPLMLPPLHHSSSALQVVTALEPTPGQLRQDNLPLSRMHAATTMAQTLPYLSDRPPSYRYLQVDTQGVGFPPVGGELEPLFCSLAIYNVETVSGGTNRQQPAAPVPDLQRCGRVTEVLHFDIARETEVAESCASALWPFDGDQPFAAMLLGRKHGGNNDHRPRKADPGERLEGTRCGVFPLPSNLNFANLYAVLLVHKVLSEDSLDVYLKPGFVPPDLSKPREHAARASQRYGAFLMPFAFGVAPLLQVFGGAENPAVTSSRAVQIPLFRFSPGHGERQVIDHIMVMLNPKADHRGASTGGAVARTNGGTAMLVMRNFGFLGLHQVVDPVSSLARDRLVDFTGELQLRRRTEKETTRDQESTPHDSEREKDGPVADAFRSKLPEWEPNYIAEPTSHGGRNESSSPANVDEGQSRLLRYAQELAALPLHLNPSMRMGPHMQRGRLHGKDIEPFYHTSFCNEMLVHPRLIHNCPKGNIVIKVEMREIEWNQSLMAYMAHLPSAGPALHNNRRGPFLVQSSFSSCMPRGSDNQFMDEFKIKLPLDLKPKGKEGSMRTLSLIFTIYNVRMTSKNKWKRARKLFTSDSSSSQDDSDPVSRMEQIACGFLPVTSSTCMIDSGLHDVRAIYMAQSPPQSLCDRNLVDETALVLMERNEAAEQTGREPSYAEDTTVSNDSGHALDSSRNDNNSVASTADATSVAEDSLSKSERGRSQNEPISMSVRLVVHSSVHSQNEVLSDFLSQEPDHPSLSQPLSTAFLSKIRMGHEFLVTKSLETLERNGPVAEGRLCDSTIELVKYQISPVARTHGFLLRIVPVLWRSLLAGSGEPDLAWANPATALPLRLHTFATILQIVGGISLFLTKNGVTQVDGKSKWNVVVLGRVVALLFDEKKLFGEYATEVFDDDYWASLEAQVNDRPGSPSSTATGGRKGRHVRRNYDISHDLGKTGSRSCSGIDIDFSTPFVFPPDEIGTTAADTSLPLPAGSPEAQKGSISTSGDSTLAPPRREVKVDSKTDFRSALRAAAGEDEEDLIRSKTSGSQTAQAMIQAFDRLGVTGNRKWMTAPTRALSIIPECEDIDLEVPDVNQSRSDDTLSTKDTVSSVSDGTKDVSDDEIVLNKRIVKLMRIPRSRKQPATLDLADVFAIPEEETTPKVEFAESKQQSESAPLSDDEIQKAGTAFIDVISESLGHSSGKYSTAMEERRVGSSHHRDTREKSSIDWRLLGDGTLSSMGTLLSSSETAKGASKDRSEEIPTLKKEKSTVVRLPHFADRLVAITNGSSRNARWFPFAYEVVILTWSAILIEQRTVGDKNRADRSGQNSGQQIPPGGESVTQAAARSIGVAVAGAPLLFEVIKQSLGFRILTLFKEVLSKQGSRTSPPLVTLDATLLLALEQVVSMVADACMDSRNFDSWDLRQMSIDVNDSIIRFLRDMFSFLAPACVHRLILAYLSRFVTKEGKHWQDRDSSIGLRCSWEISKLRLNCVSALIRFPDFIRVNGPQMLNWMNWWAPSPLRSDQFFDDTLKQYQGYQLAAFVGNEGSNQNSKIEIPDIHPHWLSEFVVDVCLLGTEHAEPQIQQRSAALLHELFWSCSQEGILGGICGPVASMHISFLKKILTHVNYLSNFAPKSQLRRDILPCAVFVLQSAPNGLLRALWRHLCRGLPGKSADEKHGGSGFPQSKNADTGKDNLVTAPEGSDTKDEPTILDIFSLLNLSLRTMEYEGSEEHLDGNGAGASRDNIDLWRKEYLPARANTPTSDHRVRRKGNSSGLRGTADEHYSSSISRKWHGHDSSMVIVNTGHQIVWELFNILNSSAEGASYLNPAVQTTRTPTKSSFSGPLSHFANLNRRDIILFVRAASSLYLHSLALRQSDIVVIRTFKVSAELLKIFGIKTFLEATGETLQHWMRVILLQCGARRANVRIEAADLLELILRSTWECFGSFFRIRVPLLAIQTEVMERLVATAAARYYRDQRRQKATVEPFSNVSAEASLVPLWRTFDRIEKQPASQNSGFRGALIRMSGKLKKLYRAYIAARVLSVIQGARANEEPKELSMDHDKEALLRAGRISILRVINASEGHSKQFLGFHATTQQRSRLAHFEAVEDALINAADVFSPTELPEHRVAWLRMLAEFHASRRRFAEEATCHFYIHLTLQQAARLHGSLWSNTPFLPWTDSMSDPVYIDGDTPTVDPDYDTDYGFDDGSGPYGSSPNSFRRIFYRVANSVAMVQDDWESGAGHYLFCGISTLHEYQTVAPWITLHDMEDQMVEEAEIAGELFLRAGIIESSRFAWTLATQHYVQNFNYSKLAIAYGNLARAVVSKPPPVDPSLPEEVSAVLGRFYRVWFHGGAPDELSGVEFVYRSEGNVRLEQFGKELREVIKSIIPDNTPIFLVLDGTSEERLDDERSSITFGGFNRLGPTPLEPVKIKVTPLRPLLERRTNMRGLPEWFFHYVDETFKGSQRRSRSDLDTSTGRLNGSLGARGGAMGQRRREHVRSYSSSMFSSTESSPGGATAARRLTQSVGGRAPRLHLMGGDLSGVDKFCFVQPRDRQKTKEWWRNCSGDYAEKTLKVTQLQVAQSFPACVTRQAVVHRLVYTQSPFEAGVDALCQWNAVLFRTAVATIGMMVSGSNPDPGIGSDAVKVVADCIHSSHVKEIGLVLMKKNTDFSEGESNSDFTIDHNDRLADDEIQKLQVKIARLIVVFIELLHLLIARNRQILLTVIHQRKRGESTSGGSVPGYRSIGPVPGSLEMLHARSASSNEVNGHMARQGAESQTPIPDGVPLSPTHHRANTFGSFGGKEAPRAPTTTQFHRAHSEADGRSISGGGVRAESAIAVQSELQRAFINMVKTLYPRLQGILQSDTPRWLKQCAQDSYFSLGTYKMTLIPIAEELCFPSGSLTDTPGGLSQPGENFERGLDGGSVGGGSNHSVVSRGSERFGFGNF